MHRWISKIAQKCRSVIPSQNNRKIDFIVCGTQKGGTSALDVYLREHRQICMARIKEVHFFDNEEYFKAKSPPYKKYHCFFEHKNPDKLLGECTPIYMYWYDAPRRIWEYNKHIKLIIVLRNPIERAYSHWNMMRVKKLDKFTFWDAIRNEDTRCREALPFQHRDYSYIDRGFYLEQIRRIWAYFDKKQVLVIKNEYLKNQMHDALYDVCEFLGVEPLKNIKAKNVHSRAYENKITETEKEYLKEVYKYEIKGLEKTLAWDCSDWLSY